MSFSPLGSLRAHVRLAQWLGPWAADGAQPEAVSCRRIEEAGFAARVYAPVGIAPIGSYLISHGLLVRGPDDPRCDRFARVLAHAGFVVVVPRLSTFTHLRVDASSAADLGWGLRTLLALPEHPRDMLPGVFSISFGSLPALLVAASRELGPQIGSLVVFGGYANFVETCRYMLGAEGEAGPHPPPDPTCLAGLAINSAHLLFSGDDESRLRHAWHRFASAVWGAPDLRAPERFATVAHGLADDLPPTLRDVFLQGCAVTPGFAPVLAEALSRGDFTAADPRPRLAEVRCPVHIIHGRNDDVIPCAQMEVLAAGLTAIKPRRYLTGLYDHSRTQSGGGGNPGLAARLGEIATMAGMLHAIIVSGRIHARRARG